MHRLSVLLFLLTVTVTTGDNVDLFWNLYDAVVAGGRILHDVAEGVGAVSKAIRAIDNFMDATTHIQVADALSKGEETKEDQLTEEEPDSLLDASDVPIPPSFSGCGALGVQLRDASLPITTMTDCCSVHESCYTASCRANKKDCDGKLKSCLYMACDGHGSDKMMQKNCRSAAKLLFSGTMVLSFEKFNSAQNELGCRRPPMKGGKKG